jgi:hypothetical protein
MNKLEYYETQLSIKKAVIAELHLSDPTIPALNAEIKILESCKKQARP